MNLKMQHHVTNKVVRILSIVLFAASIFLLWFCSRNTPNWDSSGNIDASRQTQQLDELNRIYRIYLNSEYQEAKEAINKGCLLLLEGSEFSRNRTLWIGYARLHKLEFTEGNIDLANIAFQKAKYWRLISLESRGASTEEISNFLQEFTPDKCRKMLMEYDEYYLSNGNS